MSKCRNDPLVSDPVRLVVSDIDGTLVDGKKQLTPATIDAVAKLVAAGIGFTIISARPRSGMMPIAEALAIDAPMGAFNGGTIFHRDGRVLCHHLVDGAVARAILDIAADFAVDRWVFADDRWYASTEQGKHVTSERIASDQAPVITADFAALADRTDKITFVSDEPDVLKELHDRIRQFDDRATIAQSQTYYLDITAPDANKGVGIAALSEAIGVPLPAVLAIGDQANDLPMFARAGQSIAMGQGPEAVRAKAGWVTAGNDQDGVAQAILERILR
jgi:hypothetical protein